MRRRARPRRRLRVRGRAVRRRRRASPPARSCSTRRCPATRRSITDPSYAGQIITFTNPHIGNYGVNATDFEAAGRSAAASSCASWPAGRATAAPRPTSRRCSRRYGIPGIAGIDTRRLTRLIRDTGAIPGAFGPADRPRRGPRPRPRPSPAPTASTSSPRSRRPSRTPSPATAPLRIVAYDFGIKRTILRHLAGLGTVEVVPASTPAADVLARQPDGVFLSNGPGDPAEVPVRRRRRSASCSARCRCSASASATSCSAGRSAPTTVQAAVRPPRRQPPGARTSTTGSDRDHQPEPQLRRRRRHARRPGVEVTHVNLNDGVCEGLRGARRPRVQRAAPPRGRPRPARQRLPVRPLRSMRLIGG